MTSRLPDPWPAWIRSYCGSNAYWYVPKGFTFKRSSLTVVRSRLRHLRRFNGRPWREVQAEYRDALRRDGLFSGSERDTDGSAIARMIKVPLETAGLAWTDPNDSVYVTEVGDRFLEARSPARVLEQQLWRWQFWNPAVGTRSHSSIRLFPHVALLSVMLRLADHRVSADEYELFVARMKSAEDVDEVVQWIARWRATDATVQAAITRELLRRDVRRTADSATDGPTRRSSLLNTIRLNRTYAWGWLGLPEYVISEGGTISLDPDARDRLEDRVTEHASGSPPMTFDSRLDWIGWYGQHFSDQELASAVQAEASRRMEYEAILRLTGKRVRDAMRRGDRLDALHMFLLERDLEDYLAGHLGELEPGLVLRRDGRQYQTPAGRIDLLATDAQGRTVVIELKRGRTSDKVVSQTLRYIGWAQTRPGGGVGDVRGIIVARGVDEKLLFALRGASTKIDLRRYDLGFRFSVVRGPS